MRTYEELRTEFKEKVEKLQKECKHPQDNRIWIDRWVGVNKIEEILVCVVCHKQLERRDTEPHAILGDGLFCKWENGILKAVETKEELFSGVAIARDD